MTKLPSILIDVHVLQVLIHFLLQLFQLLLCYLPVDCFLVCFDDFVCWNAEEWNTESLEPTLEVGFHDFLRLVDLAVVDLEFWMHDVRGLQGGLIFLPLVPPVIR